ncbi:MAG: response regulator transcription factor [Anaerolineae bacterium]
MEEVDLRVLIVGDDPLARAGLATMLQQEGCTVVGQAAGAADLPLEPDLYRPDVVLWDLGWDPEAGLEETLQELEALAAGETAVVALLPDEEHAAEVQAAGALGLLLREAPAALLVAALRAAALGLLVLDSDLAPGARLPAAAAGAPPVEALTPRESEVLQLLAEGLTNRAIALELEISEHTVKFHVNAILGKLGAQSRTEAVVRAVQAGLVFI